MSQFWWGVLVGMFFQATVGTVWQQWRTEQNADGGK